MRLVADAAGVLCSELFPGLRLDVPVLLRDDLAAVLDRLGQGLASPERAAFVARLRRGWARREECQLEFGALIPLSMDDSDHDGLLGRRSRAVCR